MVTAAIRTAEPDDAAGIADLVEHLGYPTDAASMRLRLEGILGDPDWVTLVAEGESRLVGLAGGMLHRSYEYDGTVCRLSGLVVDPAHHGGGIGVRLLAAVEAWARECGAAMVTLTSGIWRDNAHHFYKRRGYRLTGYRFRKDLVSSA